MSRLSTAEIQMSVSAGSPPFQGELTLGRYRRGGAIYQWQNLQPVDVESDLVFQQGVSSITMCEPVRKQTDRDTQAGTGEKGH